MFSPTALKTSATSGTKRGLITAPEPHVIS